MEPDWILTEEEIGRILEATGTDYRGELCIAQSKKLLEWLIAQCVIEVSIGEDEEDFIEMVEMEVLQSMLKELEATK